MAHTEPGADDVRTAVRARYGAIATAAAPPPPAARVARAVGYTEGDIGAVPETANLGLGCGNPVALASLQAGDVVLDLGSGAGFDALLAARAVGPRGRVIGVDMTPAMVAKARANARAAGIDTVEFREGRIEALPVDSGSVDVVISNCVVNLSPEKPRVFAEAFRVLRPGGRLMISDLVALAPLPASIQRSMAAYVGCIAGVSLKGDYVHMLCEVGFDRVEIAGEKKAAELLGVSDLASAACACSDPVVQGLLGDLVKEVPLEEILVAAGLVVSVQIAAHKRAE